MGKMKAFLLMLVAGFIFAGFNNHVAAQHFFDDDGLLIEGRTMLPMRDIFESVGASIEWNQDTKTVTAKKDGKVISLPIGSTHPKVNGKLVVIDVPAQVIEGSTYVPVRFVAESLDVEIGWDQYNRTATVYAENGTIYVKAYAAVNTAGVSKKYGPNPNYVYVYGYYEGTSRREYLGTNKGINIWKSQFTYGGTRPPNRLYYKENKYGLYLWTDYAKTPVRLIKYPAYIGQHWNVESYGETIGMVITDVNVTYQTPVKKFHNVIEVRDSWGTYSYYAKGFGHVGSSNPQDPVQVSEIQVLKRK